MGWNSLRRRRRWIWYPNRKEATTRETAEVTREIRRWIVENKPCTFLALLTSLLVISTLMKEPEFEWDAVKAARNEADHGVTFEMARDVFKDPFAVEWLDDREDYGEDRYVIIGLVKSRLLFVAYTMRGEVIRIISARGAEPHERRQYHEENG
jgi:uncharacterized DUF497 family protein